MFLWCNIFYKINSCNKTWMHTLTCTSKCPSFIINLVTLFYKIKWEGSMTYLRSLLLRTKAQIVPDMISAEIQSMALISASRLQLT